MTETIASSPKSRPAGAAAHGSPSGHGRVVGGLLGFAVLAQAACFAIVVAAVAGAAIAEPSDIAGRLPLGLGWLVALTLAGTALCSAALPAAVRHAQATDALDERARRRWLIRLALWGPLTMPVYWGRYVRARPPSPSE